MSAEKIEKKEAKKLAVIRIRGLNRLKVKVDDTMKMLHLFKKNYCTIVPATDSIVGMIKKSKDYVTWGEIDAETEKELKEKKQETTKDKEGNDIPKKFFRLNPPIGGFERKGTKIPFSKGGALGYRADKINKLIKKMI